MKKNAFTLLELVFVIVIIGILATQFFNTQDDNKLALAKNQVIAHIRYTQHLAMMDDKFDADESTWYKRRWQIWFSKTGYSNSTWAYTIYSDGPNHDTIPNALSNTNDTIATDPLSGKYLSGGYLSVITETNPQRSKKMDLGTSYGIEDIEFSSNCTPEWRTLYFDYLGRPMHGKPNYLVSPYAIATSSALVTTPCEIKLCTNYPCSTALENEIATITIEPETGYAY